MSRRPALAMVSTRSDDADEPELADTPSAPAAAQTASVVAELTGADLSTPLTVEQLPTPYDVDESVTRPLSDREREHLAVCEQALRGFRRSVIVAGKALEVISRARLYRETHRTFADYVAEVWEMKRAHAYRMIEAWRPAALVSPIGDIPEGQARELAPVLKQYGPEATVALYREVRELRGERRVTAADLAEARAVLPPPQRLARPEQVRDVLTVAVREGRAPRLAPAAPQVPEQVVEERPATDDDRVVHEGAEAIAVLEAAVAQQRQIYDRIGGGVLAAARLYDPGRADYLCRELRQYANRTSYRAGKLTEGDES
ncbi:hypothetical protein ACFQWA_28055 [Streptomyces thermogriseus]|uniref:Uncharacterized protein n=1 Tax=Streptomyces thermogriseus TaxID=75292 RepID=A0ABP4DPL1_9ACTN